MDVDGSLSTITPITQRRRGRPLCLIIRYRQPVVPSGVYGNQPRSFAMASFRCNPYVVNVKCKTRLVSACSSRMFRNGLYRGANSVLSKPTYKNVLAAVGVLGASKKECATRKTTTVRSYSLKNRKYIRRGDVGKCTHTATMVSGHRFDRLATKPASWSESVQLISSYVYVSRFCSRLFFSWFAGMRP